MNPKELDSALTAIRTREWPGASHNPKFEEYFMHERAQPRPSITTRTIKRYGLLVALGLLLTGGTVYGAVRLYESYTCTVHVVINGEPIELQATFDANGDAYAENHVTTADGDAVGQVQIHIDSTYLPLPSPAPETPGAEQKASKTPYTVGEKAPKAPR